MALRWLPLLLLVPQKRVGDGGRGGSGDCTKTREGLRRELEIGLRRV